MDPPVQTIRRQAICSNLGPDHTSDNKHAVNEPGTCHEIPAPVDISRPAPRYWKRRVQTVLNRSAGLRRGNHKIECLCLQ